MADRKPSAANPRSRSAPNHDRDQERDHDGYGYGHDIDIDIDIDHTPDPIAQPPQPPPPSLLPPLSLSAPNTPSPTDHKAPNLRSGAPSALSLSPPSPRYDSLNACLDIITPSSLVTLPTYHTLFPLSLSNPSITCRFVCKSECASQVNRSPLGSYLTPAVLFASTHQQHSIQHNISYCPPPTHSLLCLLPLTLLLNNKETRKRKKNTTYGILRPGIDCLSTHSPPTILDILEPQNTHALISA